MQPHPLTKFEMQNCYQSKPKSKINYAAYVINIDQFKSIGTHWIILYVNAENLTYFDSLGIEHIPKEIRKFIGNKNVKTNIYRIQAFDSIICGYIALDLLILC